MNIPNLINTIKNKEIEETVFNDLEINRVLSYSDIQFLKHPCNENEIKNRQEIFLSMENEEFYSSLTQCHTAIVNYEREKNIMREAQNVLEVYCSIVLLLEAYVRLCECFKKLSGYCVAADKVAAYFLSKENEEELSVIRNSISEMNGILIDISRYNLSFQVMDFIEKGHNSSSYIDAILRCANALRFDFSVQSSKSVPIDDVLIDAMQKLNEERFMRLTLIGKNHDEHLNCDFSGIKSQIRFVINIWSLVQKAASKGMPYTIPHISKNKEIRINGAYNMRANLHKCS